MSDTLEERVVTLEDKVEKLEHYVAVLRGEKPAEPPQGSAIPHPQAGNT